MRHIFIFSNTQTELNYSLGSTLTRTSFDGCVTEDCPISKLPTAADSISPDDLFMEDLLVGV